MRHLDEAEAALKTLAGPHTLPNTEDAALLQIEVVQIAERALTHLRSARVEWHVHNLEMAISLAESDPVYMLALRPSLARIWGALRRPR